jgi:hypothetical protein
MGFAASGQNRRWQFFGKNSHPVEMLDRIAADMQVRASFAASGEFPRRPGRVSPMIITRRALATRIAGAAVAFGFGTGAATSVVASPIPVMDPDLRDAALRGLALASHVAAERQGACRYRKATRG